MNPTPSDGSPSPDPSSSDAARGREADHDAARGGGASPPRPGVRPLPRRTPKVSARPPAPGQEPVFHPDHRPPDPIADETLHRLLNGLREI
jgi:hypothetical protein